MLLPAAVFSNTLKNGYHLDDVYRIVENTELDRVWPPWRHFLDRSTSATYRPLARYRPMLPLTLSINHRVSDSLGVDRLVGLHVGNLAIHILSSLLLYFLFRELIACGPPVSESRRNQISLVAAALFAVHPISGVPVNYLSARDLLLMQLFLVAATLVYVRMRARGAGTPGGYVAVASLLALSLLSKADAVGGVLLLVAFELLLRRDASLKRPLLLLGILGLGAVGVTVRWARWIPDNVSADYALTQLKVHLGSYLGSAVWPFRLRMLPEVQPPEGPVDPAALLGLAFVLGTLYLAWRWRDRQPLAAFAILGYWALLSPSSSIVALTELAAPYRPYPALPFLLLLTALALDALLRSRAAWVAAAILVLFFGLASHSLNRVWRDEQTLWGHSVRHGATAIAHVNYARSVQITDNDLAEKHYLEALQKQPDNPFALINLGMLHVQTGRQAEGLAEARRAVAIAPRRAVLRYWLSLALGFADRDEEARAEARVAADRAPTNLQYQYHAASLLHNAGEYEAALEYLGRVREHDPGYFETLLLEGIALQKLGRWTEAERTYRSLFELRPGHTTGRLHFARGLKDEGRHPDAIAAFEEVVEIDAGLAPMVYGPLAECHEALGEIEEAARYRALAAPGATPATGAGGP